MRDGRENREPCGKWLVKYRCFESFHWGGRKDAVDNFCACLDLSPEQSLKVTARMIES